MSVAAPPAGAGGPERGCSPREPGLQAAAEPRARALRQLLRRLHLPVADGRHLLALRARRRNRRAGVRLADLRSPLPGCSSSRSCSASSQATTRSRARCTSTASSRSGRLRLVRRLVLRHRTADHGRRGRHRGRQLRHRAHPQLVRLESRSGGSPDDPRHHVLLLAMQTTLNITGAKVMARVAQFGVYVEIVGTFGIALILLIHGFHHGLGFLFTTQGVAARSDEPARARLRRQLAHRRGARGRPRARLHLLRVRVGRRHRRGDEGRRAGRFRARCATR